MMSIQEALREFLLIFFYQKPVEVFQLRGLQVQHLTTLHHSLYLILQLLLYQYICLAIWGLVYDVGCPSDSIRPYIENICIRPYLGTYTEKPVYTAFWEDYRADSENSLKFIPYADKTFILGRLVMDDVVTLSRFKTSGLECLSLAFPDSLPLVAENLHDGGIKYRS